MKSYSGLDLCHISYSAPNKPPCVLTESAEFQSGVGSLRLVGSSLNSIRSECVLRSVLRISRHTADSVKTHDLLRIENRLEISRRFPLRSRTSLWFADTDIIHYLMKKKYARKDKKSAPSRLHFYSVVFTHKLRHAHASY